MTTARSILRDWLLPFLHLFFPRYCAICGGTLDETEQTLCLRCHTHLPRTNYHLWSGNPVERNFWGKMPIARASAWFFYQRGGICARLIFQMKYQGRKDMASDVGKMMAAELLPSGFFDGIDCLLPVPLHPIRMKQRGYNQSEHLAMGISAVTGIPIDRTSVSRVRNTESQTRKGMEERQESMRGAFRASHPEKLRGKHVLLLDDVMTTGATLTAVADSLKDAEGMTVSILTIATAVF